MYPLAEFDGTMKSIDWSKVPQGPAAKDSDEEVKWVVPQKFVDQLDAVLADAPPLLGEEARYAQVRGVLEAAKADPRRREAMTKAAVDAEKDVVAPLFQFRAWGQQLPYHWSTISNEAAFGTDYFTRTAVAKSNILVNAPKETKYFYQDLDAAGARLNSRNRYTVTFPKGLTPPVNGFWSLTLYNQNHFFAPNPIGRRGRLAHHLRAGRSATRGTARQLAADAARWRWQCRDERRLLALHPRLLAEGCRPGRRLDAAAGGERGLKRIPKWRHFLPSNAGEVSASYADSAPSQALGGHELHYRCS
jgi:hypothetical protein